MSAREARATTRPARWPAWAAALALAFAGAPAARAQAEIPAGTRFLVELQHKLDAGHVHRGKKIEARTIEPLTAEDGSTIPAGTKLTGKVSYVREDQMILRFDRIEPPGGKRPLVATVTGVVGEKGVKEATGSEGEIKAESHRGRDAAIGAAVLGGVGAAVGGAQAGGKGAAIGATQGGRRLVLEEGTRLELRLDRPLDFRPRP